MDRLIEDLLRLSFLGRKPLLMQPINMSKLVQEVLSDVKKQMSKRPIEAEIRVGSLPDASGDLALLRQVFFNLLSNACKFTSHLERAIIEVGSWQLNNATVYFVRDNGAGFDMRYAHKLFGVFQRLHVQNEFEGTGVGLSIVQRILQRHGGRVWAEAEVNKGATFYFTISA